MTEWFKNWFNTEIYLDVYRHRNDEDAGELVRLILANLKLDKNAAILDMACGAGRHSILFAKEGYDVTAVDLSENLLKVAKQSSFEANVKVNYLNCDLRKFSISKNFDLVANLFTSFGYFEDDKENYEVIKTAYAHTKENGYFILDYFNSNYVRNNLVPITEEKFSIGTVTQRRSIEGNRVIKKISVGKNGEEKRYVESVRLYNKSELEKIILDTGYTIIKEFGDFKGNPFDLESSPRIIIIARK